MRDFFIRGFETILAIVLILTAIGIGVMAGIIAFSPEPVAGVAAQGRFGSLDLPVRGPLAGLAVLVAGFIALIVYGGLLYLGLGIYHNTRRVAEALEARGGRY